jgi:hypothetical protein
MVPSPTDPSAYEVLGVSPSASQDELRKAYRRLARESHPDLGGAPERFHSVQLAWERIGDPIARAAYDRGDGSGRSEPAGARSSDRPRPPSQVKARSYGHPGGLERERYLTLLREWVGRGVEIPDPYDPLLLRGAPAEIRWWLAKAMAEEATATDVSVLGIGFTVWNNIVVPRGGGNLDHLVLGPGGLFAIASEDWGSPVRLLKGEIVGTGLAQGEEPIRELAQAARAVARSVGVTVSGLIVVVPDSAVEQSISVVERGRHRGAMLIARSTLGHVLRTAPGVGEVFEVRSRLQQGIRLA